MSGDTFGHLAGSYVRKDGTIGLLSRGSDRPKDAAAGELERLDGLGAFPAPSATAPATGPGTGDAPSTPDGVGAWMRETKPKVSEVLEMVGDDAALAEAALAAESEITGGEPRKSLAEKLTAIVEAATAPATGPGTGEGSGEGDPPQDPAE